jgi:hypothetical protein
LYQFQGIDISIKSPEIFVDSSLTISLDAWIIWGVASNAVKNIYIKNLREVLQQQAKLTSWEVGLSVEAIIHRNNRSPRAERTLNNYSEMKKAMKQALSDIDECKTAAQYLQMLR